MRVLDIGAGSGILSLWALEAGAAHVDAIDNSTIGTTLSATFCANGFADRSTVHVAYSKQIEPASKADLVISETLGHIGIDEGILDTCADARQRLMTDEATFIPSAFDVVAWPVWVPDFEKKLNDFWLAKPYGFDFPELQQLTRRMTYLTETSYGQRISASGVLARHTIGEAPAETWHGKTTCAAEFPSLCNGFFLSFIADLGQGIVCDGERTTSWKVLFLPAPQVFDVKRHDSVGLEFTIPRTGNVRYSIQNAGAETMDVEISA
ncbi:MAG: class I SAM-dependent methyltransferase, partial [Clostridia bacterium]|nr:class I SAM-dependent methyltransferase [Deltaproteobacteria bacterium]